MSEVTELLKKWSWEVVDNGGIDGARELEPMCILWVKHGVFTGKWMHAFKLLHQ